MEHLEPYTPEYPRESFRARLINYAPSICIVAFMVLVPLPYAYRWSSLASQWVGLWGYALFIGSSILTLGYLGYIYWTRPAHYPPLQPVDNITKLCRAACILFNLLIFTAWGNSFVILATILLEKEPERHLKFKLTMSERSCARIQRGTENLSLYPSQFSSYADISFSTQPPTNTSSDLIVQLIFDLISYIDHVAKMRSMQQKARPATICSSADGPTVTMKRLYGFSRRLLQDLGSTIV
ncbi:hypothetical protein F5878DRAFT_361958 [Lentinula raphanica]|uniref:Uncharacterized protein n=1 Tax=Lentinula raphanica TaxID=153919 RepID=A0AA38P1B8_9AGAR|nr:hypothetical protein F5878DRAFT_361958 [Lentinula raphanica]